MVAGDENFERERTFPPKLTPRYMGPEPPSKLDRSLYEAGSAGYFQNYRNETLSKFSMPPYQWGMEKPSYSPCTDISVEKVRRRLNRDLNVPASDISTIDRKRMREVDDLFKLVQVHRSQYKDRTGSIHPVVYFNADEYPFQCSPGMTSSYFSKYPTRFVDYKHLAVLPITYGRKKQTPYIPDLSLAGIYSKESCIAYKR